MRLSSIFNPISGLRSCNELVAAIATERKWDSTQASRLLQKVHRAILDGKLPSRDPETAHIADKNSESPLVTLADFNKWLGENGVPYSAPELMLGKTSSQVERKACKDPPWKTRARTMADEIIERDTKKSLFPSQNDIADEIARKFRVDGIVGNNGKPLTGTTIKRHALLGITSSLNKLKATENSRGK